MLRDRLNELASRLRRGRSSAAEIGDAAPATPSAADVESGRLHLDVMFSDAQWRLELSGHGEGAARESRQGALVDGHSLENDGGSADGLREALRTLAPGERALVASVALYPVDPEIELFDNRAIRAFSAELAALRPIAEGVAGTVDCAFDSAPLGDPASERRLIAICRIELLRRYLNVLGDLAPKLRGIAPDQARWLAGEARGPRAILHVGAGSSLFLAADPANGVVAARAVPAGVAAFARLVADANSLPLPEAAQEMAERDMAARAVAAGMDAPLRDLTRLVEETEAFVAESRLADIAPAIELSGATEAVHGLADLLSEALDRPVEDVRPGDVTGASGLNLLRSADGPIFAEGTREYVFEGDRFVGREIDGRKVQAAKTKAARGKAPPKRFLGVEIGGFSGDLTPKRIAAMAAGAAALAAFGFYDLLLAPSAAALVIASDRYSGEQTSTLTLTDQVLNLRSAARRDALAASGADKILWAEKFVSISRALPTGLWLTDATIRTADRRVGQVDVVATKLVLAGVARSVGRRRLQDIAAFIEALERDEAFMRDFRSVTFAGLGAEGADAAFEIHAWYDENKRRESETSDEGANPLSAATAAAAARRRVTPLPTGGPRR